MYDILTSFEDELGVCLGTYGGILPITLEKGMTITIHGHQDKFFVVNWSYHHGHPDESTALRIVLRPQGVISPT